VRETYGTQPKTKPEGMLREIIFPELALMDVKTGDGRLLESDGRGVRDLPRTLYGQFSQQPDHEGAVIIGALHEVAFEDGVASGRGWVLDDDNGRTAVKYLKTQSLRHNSVDLAEVKARLDFDEESGELSVTFLHWKIAATTLVGKPAFANASAELLEDDEVVASWFAEEGPLVVDAPTIARIEVAEPELVADGALLPAWEAFHVAEPDQPRKLTVDANGWVSGHLALWESCHEGYARCTRVPRPPDNYASFNKPGVLTDRGLVETGPIFLAGGHRRAPNGDYESAYGGIENAWADVRVTAGVHGPWLSGIVRPGTPDDKVYAARASRISGHWKGGRLKAIVSVNAEGFDVPGSGFAAFEFSTDEAGIVDELVASFPVCADTEEPAVEEAEPDTVPAARPDFAASRLALALALQDDDA